MRDRELVCGEYGRAWLSRNRNMRPQLPVPRPTPSETGISDVSDTSLTIEELDLLIRSASTFLSIVQQQIEPPSRCSKDHPQYKVLMAADRMATLLSCREKSDITAVLLVQGRDSSTIFTISEDAVTPIQGLYSMKNSTGTATEKSSSIPLPQGIHPPPNKKFGDNWKTVFLQSGPFDPASHAKQLESFTEKYYAAKTASNTSVTGTIVLELEQFTYAQCLNKVKQRFNSPLHPYSNQRFYNVFLRAPELEQILTAGPQLLPNKRSLNLPASLLASKENIILDIAKKILPEYDFILDNDGHIKLDQASVYPYYKIVQKVFQEAMESIDHVSAARTRGNNISVSYFTDQLKNLTRDFRLLSLLVNHCVSFQVFLNHPAIKNWIVAMALKDELGDSGRLKQEDRILLEDEDVLLSKELVTSNPIGCLIKWLQLTVQWSTGVASLAKRVKRPVNITSLKQETYKMSEQTSLDTLIDHTLKDRPGEQVELCKNKLKAKAKEQVTREAREPSENWELVERWDGWETAFTGKHHCEASLGCMRHCDVGLITKDLLPPGRRERFMTLIEEVKRCSNMVGVSKACCFLCRLYIDIACPGLVYRGSSGKIFPWAIPPFERNLCVYDKIWGTLKDEVWKALVALEVLQCERRESGSEDGLDYDSPDEMMSCAGLW